jgi:non-specific serine/threonine protein kinase
MAERIAERSDALDLLSRLVDKSLVVAEAGGDGGVRYRLLEPVRQYAHERLVSSGNAEAVQTHHARAFLELAERARPELTGPDQAAWLDRLEWEHDNLRAALNWSHRQEDTETGLHLVAALWMFWYVRCYLREGREWLGTMLRASSGRRSVARAQALRGAGVLAYAQGSYDEATPLCEEALHLFRKLGQEQGAADCLNNLAVLAIMRGDAERATVLHGEALNLRRKLGDKLGVAGSLVNLGWVAQTQGNYERARALYEEGLALEREFGNVLAVAFSLFNLGHLAVDQGDPFQAEPYLAECLLLFRDVGEKTQIASCLEQLACTAAMRHQPSRAARLHGAAEALRLAIGSPMHPHESAQYRRHLGEVRAAMHDGSLASAREEGRAMTLEQAIEYALDTRESTAITRGEQPSIEVLTRREREIAGLVAKGLTNRQIAEALVIAERTVDTHVGKILSKLGVTSRAQVAGCLAHDEPGAHQERQPA